MHNLKTRLKTLNEKNRLRRLPSTDPQGIDLASNDYLGFATHPALRAAALRFFEKNGPLGAGASRLLRGHHEAHAELEDTAARYFSAPKTLFFSSGFQANQALFQALPDRHDTILFDALIHASARSAIQSSPARHVRFPHNDMDACEDVLKKARVQTKGQIWIAVESLYSMDGDAAPLEELYALAQRYDAALIIDEAHAVGVCGPTGRGLSEPLTAAQGYERIITMHTCGKALGVAGGLVCASAPVIDWLVNTARSFIYSTAPMPVQAHLVKAALELLDTEEGQTRRARLQSLCKQAQSLLGGPGSHIVPVMIGDDAQALNIAQNLQDQGFDIRAIRPPTVPEGAARLRVSLNADLPPPTLEHFAKALKAAIKDKTGNKAA